MWGSRPATLPPCLQRKPAGGCGPAIGPRLAGGRGGRGAGSAARIAPSPPPKRASRGTCGRSSPREGSSGEAKAWSKKDDDIEEGDLPEHKRPSAPIDFSKIDPSKPESILQMTKKGKTLMMFVTVSGEPTEKETEEITNLWQGSLFNANYDVQRFIVGSNRAIFMLRDGSYAWEIKDFLVNQERCADVTVEGQTYPGKGAKEKEKEKNKTKAEKSKKKKETGKKPEAVKENNRASKLKEDL